MLRILSYFSLKELIDKGIFINKILREKLLNPKKSHKKIL
jgi:hypothetical protein